MKGSEEVLATLSTIQGFLSLVSLQSSRGRQRKPMTPACQPANQVPDSQGQALHLVIRPRTYPTSDPHPQPRSGGWGLIGLRALPTKRRLVDPQLWYAD